MRFFMHSVFSTLKISDGGSCTQNSQGHSILNHSERERERKGGGGGKRENEKERGRIARESEGGGGVKICSFSHGNISISSYFIERKAFVLFCSSCFLMEPSLPLFSYVTQFFLLFISSEFQFSSLRFSCFFMSCNEENARSH